MASDDDLQAVTVACRDDRQADLDALAPKIGIAVNLVELRLLVAHVRCTMIEVADLAKLAITALEVGSGLAIHVVKKPRKRSSSAPLYWEWS